MNTLAKELIAQTVMVVLVTLVAGFTALITALPIGGAAFGVAPEAHINLVSGVMCPAGNKVVFEEGGQVVTNSGDGPSYGTAVSIHCEDANGVRSELAAGDLVAPFFGAIGLVLGGYFLACFGPLFLVGVILGGVLTHKLVRGSANRRPAQAHPQPTVL